MRKAWNNPSAENREALRRFNAPEMIKWQYTEGVEDTSLIAPEGYQLASAAIDRIGVEVQMDLLLNYGQNIRQYEELHEFFRQYQPPTLAIWGRHDPFFTPAGADAFKRDNPKPKCGFSIPATWLLKPTAGKSRPRCWSSWAVASRLERQLQGRDSVRSATARIKLWQDLRCAEWYRGLCGCFRNGRFSGRRTYG